jgi:hypothetical protein
MATATAASANNPAEQASATVSVTVSAS